MRFYKVILSLVYVGLLNHVSAQSIWQSQHHSKRYILKSGTSDLVSDTLYLSIPEQYVNDVPLWTNYKGDSLLAQSTRGFKIKLQNKNADSIIAQFEYYNDAFNLNFKKVNAIKDLFFSQHPKKPYPYFVDNVKFKGSETGLVYGGTLTIPKGKSKYPLAVLISGTGQHDRNYTYSGHQFFTVLADYLARNGIASLRVADRGKDETTGDFSLATSLDFANDVQEALNYLKNRTDIDHSFLGLIGHSEGGMIASIETSRNKDVKFMVSLAGVAVSGLKTLELQNKAILKGIHKTDGLLDKHMEMFNTMFQTVYHSKKEDSLELRLEHSVTKWKQEQDSTTIKALNLDDGRDLDLIYRYARIAKTNWYRYMIHYNSKKYLSKIKVPVLALNGEQDIMVLSNENLEAYRKYLPKKKKITTKVYSKLNHMFQHCEKCTNEEISELEEVFSEEALKDISKWIKQIESH
ncbi:acyl-CoA thioester hydrolase/BAAT C-terminal domain-containing protein [Aestuariibaculum sp. YM273]|uniref:alpha/beta hydrolase n=1 Tax=Aestuariibaculum sp. YM273 TaxID=3070659 RepID=UPI0027DB5B1A|nr:alpha/beta fold hydrolase [Aestuariibaculum sp. YM273]WMI64144.1 acyl-CoA thioester hydrolase/BAAT C-terminal domain-containing protein [Aestuariibaculum sp. YM273]